MTVETSPPAPTPPPGTQAGVMGKMPKTRNGKIAVGCGALVVLCFVCSFVSYGLQEVGILPKPTPAPTATTAPTLTESEARYTESAATAAARPKDTARPKPSDTPAPKMSMDAYSQIETGMTYEQVVSIAGEPKQELSSTEFGGIKTVSYQWAGNAFASNAILMFQNGKLVSKSQIGLK